MMAALVSVGVVDGVRPGGGGGGWQRGRGGGSNPAAIVAVVIIADAVVNVAAFAALVDYVGDGAVLARRMNAVICWDDTHGIRRRHVQQGSGRGIFPSVLLARHGRLQRQEYVTDTKQRSWPNE